MHPDLAATHLSALAIIVCAAFCVERVLVAYYTWKLAKRKGRMWLPYALFGLLGLAVLALRSPAYSALSTRARSATRPGYTHTGFSGPATDAELELAEKPKRRVSPLAGYHLPHGLADQRAG